MSYLVLARKWRPQTFEDVVGQQHIMQTLQNAIAQNRVAHAFLFTGSRGVGKTSTARIFAKALNCHHAPCAEPCNACPSCLEITEGKSLDVIEIDGASNRGIDPIRELREAVRYAPARDRYKIYIIDEVHMLTTEAFNALLKTLEEPPPHALFIFATTDPNKVPVTIVSRCQQYDFKRITVNDLVAHLKRIAESENIPFEDGALQLIARTARGGARDALSSMDQIIAFAAPPITAEKAAEILGVASRETLTTLVKAVLSHDVNTAIECLQKADQYGQDLAQFAFDLLAYLRDITLCVATKNKPGVTELSANEVQTLAPVLKITSVNTLQRIFQIWYETSELIPKSLSPKLFMEMTLVKMCNVENVIPLTQILQKLDALTKTIAPNLPPNALEQVRAYLGQATSLTEPDDEKKKIPL